MDAYMPDSNDPAGEDLDESEFVLSASDVASAFGATNAEALGRGTFGETWRVDLPGGPRAVKVLVGQPTSPSRLEREVEGLERVQSPHVVRLLDTLVANIAGVPRTALVFEYVPGGTVAQRLRSGPASVQDAVVFAKGLFAGLVALHDQDVVHRDLKPENVALRDGQWAAPVVLDLGLARMLDKDSITAYPAVMGTARFMAPEQLRAERARKAADVFAGGVLLHLVMTGVHPFYEGHQTLTIDDALKLIAAGPSALPGNVPGEVRQVLVRAVAELEGDRGSAKRALRDLEK